MYVCVCNVNVTVVYSGSTFVDYYIEYIIVLLVVPHKYRPCLTL